MLFATSSFWQGVDVRGEQLSCVIMVTSQPFAVPSDPVVAAARQRHIEDSGGSSFFEYSAASGDHSPEARSWSFDSAARRIAACWPYWIRAFAPKAPGARF
ncbi:MAG: helicase C-terminal domain-containing protein [Pyrinomonadaceae bacterium]